VSALYDQSGNGVNAAQSTAAQQPTIVAASAVNLLNSTPALIFDGLSHHLFTTAPVLYAAGAATVVTAMRGNPAANGHLFSESSSVNSAPFYGILPSGNPTATALSPITRNDASGIQVASAIGPNAFNNTPRVLTLRDTGAQMEAFLDGTLSGSIAYTRTGTLTLDRQGLGALVRTPVGNFWAGRVAELVAFTSALSTGDRQTYERNLGTFTGITVA
jgi:hypothetical protein